VRVGTSLGPNIKKLKRTNRANYDSRLSCLTFRDNEDDEAKKAWSTRAESNKTANNGRRRKMPRECISESPALIVSNKALEASWREVALRIRNPY
jgi:hypothetical protein